ncbi:unnamed protein product [Sphenostylis stenocarpa]|uniref:Uncharacterized protein n=1 Tax=Sphenostylis stenocarpa TaxID=92480 RepID=A0AA86RQ16_9FABA|nr:unnamed protein product [Sphenostylis stenocarpa]
MVFLGRQRTLRNPIHCFAIVSVEHVGFDYASRFLPKNSGFRANNVPRSSPSSGNGLPYGFRKVLVGFETQSEKVGVKIGLAQ